MKALIIDNETPLRSAMQSLLKIFCPEVENIEEADGVKTGVEKIKSFQPDIVLLDVEMEDGSGFDLIKLVQPIKFQLIFVTAHDKYAIEAFQFSAIDYLLKPVDPEALQKAIQKAIHNIRNKDLGKQIEFLLQQISGRHEHERKIVLRDIDNIYFVKVSDILYCMAEGTYTKFYFTANQSVIVSKNLKEYELLLEPLGFIRTHHSYLVNAEKITRFDKSDGGLLILENNIKVPLAQRKKEAVLSLLERKA